MGELLLCHETIAALPYYIEETGINIYSMEELSYYISGNVYLRGSFLHVRVVYVQWVGKTDASCRTRNKNSRENIRTERKNRPYFVFAILQDTAYCTMKEMQEIVFAVRQMEQKSDFERDKIRADQLMEKEKYLAAIYRYKHLLDEADTKETSEVLRGNIWHNLGTAYARLFLFEEAGRCFEKAYAFNKQKESLRECLMCCRCRHDEEAFAEIAKRYQVEERKQQEIRNEISIACKSEKLEQFESHLEELAQRTGGAQKGEGKERSNGCDCSVEERLSKELQGITYDFFKFIS